VTACRPNWRGAAWGRIEIDTSLHAVWVIQAFSELVEVRGAPLSIRLDKGPDFIAHALAEGAKTKSFALNHIQPDKPTQNAYVERLNGTCRAVNRKQKNTQSSMKRNVQDFTVNCARQLTLYCMGKSRAFQ